MEVVRDGVRGVRIGAEEEQEQVPGPGPGRSWAGPAPGGAGRAQGGGSRSPEAGPRGLGQGSGVLCFKLGTLGGEGALGGKNGSGETRSTARF